MGLVPSMIHSPQLQRALLLGHDGEKKASLLEHWRAMTRSFASGCNCFCIENTEIAVWDVAGQESTSWDTCLTGADAIIWLLDAADKEGLRYARNALHTAFSPRSVAHRINCLVLVNTPDPLEGSLCAEIMDVLELDEIFGFWSVVACSVTTGDGLREGLVWLAHPYAHAPVEYQVSLAFEDGIDDNEDWIYLGHLPGTLYSDVSLTDD
ncbi:hypothetical protein ACHHYP_01579 [Achlya hypogyna]|uniref:Uncharacterized protein n=1 Tax=Achlya hypogyna TaxID=1202772 RepID=A0A1V9Z8G1_ACHHY|nr:hypothetical protein ACHHYP_01579 [Achlya hypogyna]